jgi:hypothetical protein
MITLIFSEQLATPKNPYRAFYFSQFAKLFRAEIKKDRNSMLSSDGDISAVHCPILLKLGGYIGHRRGTITLEPRAFSSPCHRMPLENVQKISINFLFPKFR